MTVKHGAVHETIAYELFGGLAILVHTAAPPTDTEWAKWIDFLNETYDFWSRGSGVLVVTAGGGPNTKQRGLLNERVTVPHGSYAPTAVVSSGAFTRAIITALSWFNRGIKGFSPEHLGQALSFLKIPDGQHALITARVAELQGALKQPRAQVG